MKKLLTFSLAAVVMEVLAMEVPVMHLPARASVVLGTLAAVLVLVALIEKPRPDERDRAITWRSSHTAFLAVAVVVTGTLLYQTIAHRVEPATLAAMAALILGKFIGRIMHERQS